MGLDDRDYMRERYRERQGLNGNPSPWSFDKAERAAAKARQQKAKPKKTIWNDKKARREIDLPPGSASWIGRNCDFDEYNLIAAAYPKRRRRTAYRGTPSGQAMSLPRALILILCLIGAGIPIFADMRRGGWLPDFASELPFPESGSVAVARDLPMALVQSRLSVVTSDANTVVQLVDPQSGRHAISVFVAANSRIDVPAPVGIWRMQVIEGQKWHGTRDFFGPNTQFETVARSMEFTAARGNGIDLHRSPNGDLPTRLMLTGPDPL